jgi:hypothetical protein
MATIGNNNPTYADVAKRLDPNGKVETIVELLNEDNEVLNDASVIEGNLPTGHRTTVRTGLPSATWRKLNYGVAKSKSQTAQVQDSAGMLEAYAEVDKALADLNGNTSAFRLSEDRAFLEAMNQEMANTLFYGDTDINPERFMGLAPRYNDLSAANGVNIIDGGGNGSDNTSIWLINWDPNVCHLFYPKGSKAGWMHDDLGQETLTDAAGGYYEGYRTHYKWDLGLTLRDWRYVVRIANIDVSDLAADKATGADLTDLLIQALEQVKGMKGRTVFYANRTITSYLRRQILNTTNVRLSMEEVYGKKSVAVDGVPVRKTDALLNTEAAVS